MAKFVFIVPPLQGHINPTLSTGTDLLRLGHEVAWIGHEFILRGKLPSHGQLIPVNDKKDYSYYETLAEKSKRISGLLSLKFLYEDILVPLAKSTYDSIKESVEKYQPDLIINDQQAWAAHIVAIQKGIKYATFCTTSAGIIEPLEGFTKITEWEEQIIVNLQKEYGIHSEKKLNNSELLTVVFSTQALISDINRFPAWFKFVGPAISSRPAEPEFPWEKFRSAQSPKILITLGTVNQEKGKDFFPKVYEAFKNKDMFIICIAPPEFFPIIPGNFIVQPFIPQLKILESLDLVICHAGHNTVCEALAHAVPLVVCPIKDDQYTIATQCVKAGVAERIKFARFKSDMLFETVKKVLSDKKYKFNAEKVMESFKKAGGSQKATELLIELTNH